MKNIFIKIKKIVRIYNVTIRLVTIYGDLLIVINVLKY